jgi:hypothetical protein
MNVTISTPSKLQRGKAPHKRRSRRDAKRRAYFADRVLRGKLTSKQKRHTARVALFAARAKALEDARIQAEAESAELDRLAALAEAKEELQPINDDGGIDVPSGL